MLQALKRPLLAQASRAAVRFPTVIRTISITPRRLSDDHGPPSLFGSGSPAGAVPTDEDQATGLERLQLMGRREGVDVFYKKPDTSRKGTMENPTMIQSLSKLRQVGCPGYPPEEHHILWLNLRPGKKSRCRECGNVFAMDYIGPEDEEEHH